MNSCKRWSRQERKHINAPMPEIVRVYNQYMGGVDITDMFLALCRITVKSKKWYLPIAQTVQQHPEVSMKKNIDSRRRMRKIGSNHLPFRRVLISINLTDNEKEDMIGYQGLI